MASQTHNSNAFTDREKMMLIPVALVGLTAVGVFLYVFTTIPSQIYSLATHGGGHVEAGEHTASLPASPLGEFFARKIPTGVELNIPKLGIENKLLEFIEDAAKPADKTTWFDFDRLLFETNSATLEPSSNEQLTNIANILKAFPKVNVKIGGYTDNTGDKVANQKLSDTRAKNVAAELVKLGIAPTRVSAEGYGDQFPVGDNATEEGRAKNRRISLRVTQK